MLSLLIKIKHKWPDIWHIIERINAVAVYSHTRKLRSKAQEVLSKMGSADYIFALIAEDDIPGLSFMLQEADAGYVANFNPHSFELAHLERLHKLKSMLMMKVVSRSQQRMIGYFFLRCYALGGVFHGLFVDEAHANRGIGTAMWNANARTCAACGLRMRATVSNINTASLRSMSKACDIVTHKHLNDNAGEYRLTPKCV